MPIDEEELEKRLGVDIESEDYRILEKELPFADDVGEDTTIGMGYQNEQERLFVQNN